MMLPSASQQGGPRVLQLRVDRHAVASRVIVRAYDPSCNDAHAPVTCLCSYLCGLCFALPDCDACRIALGFRCGACVLDPGFDYAVCSLGPGSRCDVCGF